jgi:hypothetical protein
MSEVAQAKASKAAGRGQQAEYKNTFIESFEVLSPLRLAISLHFRDGGSPSPSGEALGVEIWSRAKLPECVAQQI